MFGLFAIPAYFHPFWVANFTQMAVFSIVCASAGLLYGRVGLVSLGQVAAYGIGCWVTMRLAFATTLPYPILLIIGGLVAAVIGVIIGLPALRVSGLYLALVTLMLAAGMEIVLGQIMFPNGGSGFKGVVASLSGIKPTRRPSFATGHGLLPLRRRRRLRHVHVGFVRAVPQARSGLGVDSPERGSRTSGRHRCHSLQVVGVRAGRVHGRCRWWFVCRHRPEGHEHRRVQSPIGDLLHRRRHHGRHLHACGVDCSALSSPLAC